MKNISYIIIVGSLGLLVANAEPGKKGGKGERPSPEEVFNHLDQNSDGYLTYDEFQLPPHVRDQDTTGEKKEEVFNKIDADGDGYLSSDEFTSHRPPRKPKGEKA